MPRTDMLPTVPEETDDQLVREIAGGSAEALARLYDRHASLVYGLARRILGREEDAEEAVQDVFAAVWRRAGLYEEGRATVVGWMVMLARTRAIDRLRARRARPDLAGGVEPERLSWVPTGARDPEQVAVSLEDGRRVRAALDHLPETQRPLIEMAYYAGLTHTEIARQTCTPLGTVKTRLRSAMATLRLALSAGQGRT